MEVKLDLSKTVYENAAEYYEKAKRMREKIEGAKKALEETLKRINDLKKKKIILEENKKSKKIKKKAKQWYENFRWAFIKNFLIVGGKDAKTNEILIKKHTESNDLVMHADVFGSPFFVIKNGKNASDEVLKSVASICASYSKAWKNCVGSCDVYCVSPEQVSKTAKAGEFLAKGSFMIYGERRWFRNVPLKIYICLNFKDGEIFIVDERSKDTIQHYVCLTPGTVKAKELVNKIKRFYEDRKMEIHNISDDEIIRVIPYAQGQIIEMK